jgi:hypothetical protein
LQGNNFQVTLGLVEVRPLLEGEEEGRILLEDLAGPLVLLLLGHLRLGIDAFQFKLNALFFFFLILKMNRSKRYLLFGDLFLSGGQTGLHLSEHFERV